MKRLAICLVLLFTAPLLLAEDAADTPETRRVAAERYLEAADFENLMIASIRAGAESSSAPQKAEEALALIRRHLRIDVFKAAAVGGMVKNFTTVELNAMADFYGSPAGRSAMAKLPAYMKDVVPLMQAEVAHALQGIRQELAAKAKQPAGT